MGSAEHGSALRATIASVVHRIAPLWPLDRFVAVNPFLGLADQPLLSAAVRLGRTTGARVFMPRAYYATRFAEGAFDESCLRAGLAALAARGESVPPFGAVQRALGTARPRTEVAVSTFADVMERVRGEKVTETVTDELSRFCARYWDEGQASWVMPYRDQPLYAAWRAWAASDRTPDVLGWGAARRAFSALPTDAFATISHALVLLEVPESAASGYLHRALASVEGWASYARYRGWTSGDDTAVVDLLAMRLAWEVGLFAVCTEARTREAWGVAARAMSPLDVLVPDREFSIDLALLEASEHALQRSVLPQLRWAAAAPAERPQVQAVFCIDVRSEVFRRALESTSEATQTVGFAGFFGVALACAPLGQSEAVAHCPVLLQPKFCVREVGLRDEGTANADEARSHARRDAGLLSAFKRSTVGALAYVETLGGLTLGKLVTDALGLTQPVRQSDPQEVRIRLEGWSLQERVATAAGILRGTSLHDRLAPVVVLVAHGSTNSNNPHASGLQCGACGGHAGDPNARVAATLLNDPQVRAGLRDLGLHVPTDTVFVAALHDTTTDQVELFDTDSVPATHQYRLDCLRGDLRAAGATARTERAPALHSEASESAIVARSRDWAQVRPEWGLAGNAFFIAAPRAVTRGFSLRGRAFLHDYDSERDDDLKTLELILTAPMIVASWINLQYYASTVDPERYGSGNKTLHNVVGAIGVLEGYGGDLRTGLPLQSVHDGASSFHEPVRLHVVVQASEEAIEHVLVEHPDVRQLVEHGWVHLFALRRGGQRRCLGHGWIDVAR